MDAHLVVSKRTKMKWNTCKECILRFFSEMPHPLWRIKLCAIIRWSLQLHYKNPPPDALWEWERSYTYGKKDLTPISLRVRVIFGPIFLRVAQSLHRHKIHSTLKDLDIGPTLTWMFFWTLFPPPNELVCMLLWRMCIVVTSTMLFPLTLVLLSLLVATVFKVQTYQLYKLFPTNHLLCLWVKMQTIKIFQLCPHFQRPDTPKKKRTLT